jgi:hypothetical protein
MAFVRRRTALPTVVDAREFGLRMDNSSNDTAAINAAINACAAQGGGVVYLPPGIARVTTIVLKNHVYLQGSGMYATELIQLSATTTPVIKNHVSSNGVSGNAQFCGVRDLKINGHKAGTGGGSGVTSPNSHGIFFTMNPLHAKALGDDKFDPHFLVENVYIVYCAGVGFLQTGRSETRLANVYVEGCNGGGIDTSYDTFLTSCSAGVNKNFGFKFNNGNIMASACKAFLSGHGKDHGTNDPGFLVTGDVLSCVMSACVAQNNNGPGLLLKDTSAANIQIAVDSNNFGGTTDAGGNGADDFAGVEMDNAHHCILSFTSSQSYQSGVQIGNQAHALYLKNGSDYNDIRFTTSAEAGYTLGSDLLDGSTVLNNRIFANGVQITE